MSIKDSPHPLTRVQLARLIVALRLIGGVFVIGGLSLGLNIGQLADALGLSTGSGGDGLHEVLGGALVLVGLADIFILPAFFKRLHRH